MRPLPGPLLLRRLLAIPAGVCLLLGVASRAGSPSAAGDKAAPEVPDGEYTAVVDVFDVEDGRGLWSFTGEYDVALGAYTLELDLVTQGSGRITGTGTYHYTTCSVPLTARGTVRGSGGEVVVSLVLRGTEETIPDKEVLRVAIRMTLALDPDLGTLVGVAAVSRGTRRLGGGDGKSLPAPQGTLPKGTFSTACTLDLPAGMDGTYDILFLLSTFGERVSGEAVLTLSNGDEYPLLVRGKRAGDLSVLGLAGDPANPDARGIKAACTVLTLDDATADLDALAGKLFGQSLRW